jgi:hypothetical protein
MTTLTLNISDELLEALLLASRERSLPETTVAVEVLEGALLKETPRGNAGRWVETWRGRLKGQEATLADPRVQHLLAKHLR